MKSFDSGIDSELPLTSAEFLVKFKEQNKFVESIYGHNKTRPITFGRQNRQGET